jgi:tetraacyldisaccharide 4'-kinase
MAIRARIQRLAEAVPDPVEVVFCPDVLLAVAGEERRLLDWCRGKTVWLVSGIGNNHSFTRSAGSLGLVVVGESVFADHHRYERPDIDAIKAQMKAARADLVLTTEKDAGKLVAFLSPGDPWWTLRIKAEVRKGEAQLRDLVCSSLRAGSLKSRA